MGKNIIVQAHSSSSAAVAAAVIVVGAGAMAALAAARPSMLLALGFPILGQGARAAAHAATCRGCGPSARHEPPYCRPARNLECKNPCGCLCDFPLRADARRCKWNWFRPAFPMLGTVQLEARGLNVLAFFGGFHNQPALPWQLQQPATLERAGLPYFPARTSAGAHVRGESACPVSPAAWK